MKSGHELKPQKTKVKKDYVWTCDYCQQEFETKKESDSHELTCDKNPNRTKPKKSKWMKAASLSRIIWLISMPMFGVVAVVLSNTSDKNLTSIYSQISLISIVVVGIIAFIVMTVSFALHYSLATNPHLNRFKKMLRFVGSLVFLPFVVMRNLGDTLFGFFILLPMWIIGFFGLFYIFGLTSFSRDVLGNSMNPTILDKESIKMYSYSFINKLISKPQKGDIVIFSSGRTANDQGQVNDYVKRVVAIAGDEIEIRDGYYYLNGQIVKEPYIAKPRSTFGAAFLGECKKVVVPNGYVFVMGDNRKRSKDSRELGFVSLNEISSILPVGKQAELISRQRDASKDGDSHGLPSFNIDDYYTHINKIRTDNNLKPLKRNEKLEKAALARAKSIIENNEVGKLEKDKSKYPYDKAIKDAGYNNILTGEISTTGYYDAEELANYWLEYETKENLLDKRFQDMGLGVYVGKINDCEVQVVVNEFGGYVPPNYKKSDIDGWKSVLNSLRDIQPSWQKVKEWGSAYERNKADYDRINEIISIRIGNIQTIVTKMESNQWLSQSEINYTYKDEELYKEQEALANKLNNL